jgi:hypothetical protein
VKLSAARGERPHGLGGAIDGLPALPSFPEQARLG